MPSAWPASSISFSTFGSSITPNPISAAPTAASPPSDQRRAAVLAAAEDEVEGERDRSREPDGVHPLHRPRGGERAADRGRRDRLGMARAQRLGRRPGVRDALLAREQPEHRRAGARTTIARTAPEARTSASASPIGGQSERAGASRSLCSSRSASSERVARRAGDLAAQAVQLVRVAAQAEPVELARRRRAWRACAARAGSSSPNGVGVAEQADALADARSSGSARARAGSGRRRRARPRARAARRRRRRPDAAAASRSAAAASAEPPPIPAATGTRLAIVIRTGGPSQPVAARKRASAARGEVLALDARADDLVGVARGGLQLELVGERDGLHERHERVVPVSARAADEEAQVDLARARRQRRRVTRASSAYSARHSPGASCSARASTGLPIASSAARARSRMPGAAPGASDSERASALRRCAKPCCTSARSAGSGAGPRRVRPTSTESTFGTGWKTVRETGRRTRTSQASWASTEGTPYAGRARRARRSAPPPPSAPSRPRW